MALDPDTTLRQGQDHVTTSIGDETAVMSIKRGRYYAVGSVAERLLEEYAIAPAQCESEVGAFLSELIEEGLVEEHRP